MRRNKSYCISSHFILALHLLILAGVAQLVERQLPKLNVEGSNPFARFGGDGWRGCGGGLAARDGARAKSVPRSSADCDPCS